MPCCRNMTSGHTVDDVGYVLADANSSAGGETNSQPEQFLSLNNLDFQGKNRSVSNRDEH